MEPSLYPCFLGPYGENDALLEKLVTEFLRDHVYWRRNFHPEDPPAIPTRAAMLPEFQAFEARLRRELHSLSAALKRSVPFHSPRYMGHMVSDLLLPGLAAQMLTLPYNPNNVSDEAAPVTVDLELQVGLQFARLIGYAHDPAQAHCAFGHLTSGGTLANLQSLRLALAMKAFPVALRAAAPPDLRVPEDDWAAFNLAPDAVIELVVRWENWLASLPATERNRWAATVEGERLESLGQRDFFERHPQIAPPIVLVPHSAHYSWPKGLKLLGLGAQCCVTVAQKDLRMDLGALDEALARAHTKRQPVLMTVGVFGTTEYGAVDPIDGIVAARDRYAAAGLGFPVHVDAAWGGYLLTLFREPGGTLRSRAAVTANFEQFPSPAVHAAAAALSRTDSVTIDPHKLGYLPYGAGAFICRDHRAMSLLAIDADYAFKRATPADYLTRYGQLGRYIIEGSKPGAMAAAVYVTHRVLPLDYANFGRLPAQTLHAVEAFTTRAERFAKEYAHVVTCVPLTSDTNLVCLALNPRRNTSVSAMNDFVRRLHDELRIDPQVPVQFHEFFASSTTLHPEALGREGTLRLMRQLHLPALAHPAQSEPEPLLILRHTIMNPFLLDAENGISYIDRYFEFLSRRVAALVDTSCEGLGQMRSAATAHP